MTPQVQLAVERPGAVPRFDLVAEETPVALEYNGIAHSVMLATPADLDDFAIGFSLSEGIVARRNQIFDIEVVESAEGLTLHLEISGEAFAHLKERRRNLAGRTGCGLCGVESLAQVVRDLPPLVSSTTFPLAALHEGMRRLPAQQALQQATGATHAACHVAADGSIDHVREDVGRHNALDKTLGALSSADVAAEGALIITSRASFEMVQKAVALGYGILAAVSAPTAAAVRLAERFNLTLVGFLRNGGCSIYSHAERLQGPST
jgi:FdhD protein